ncbi:uncharacterized protein LOC131690117 [Topomyia yanbarensis]|uniref:uncharacterized protein LOC131690117 n=1 Tax=Topomyia yanbarensis TaxID=2498891 RepID=UPI00273A81D7|nr:uncharacterized protein LOC131690117 [Topomyia yanbarensis]
MRKSAALVVLAVVVAVCVREGGANFVAYDEDLTTMGDPDEEYLQDEDQRKADYHDAMNKLIASALNQTEDVGEEKKPVAEPAKAAGADAGDDGLKCAVNRQRIPITPSPLLTVNKCCPPEESFRHESIARCSVTQRRSRLSIISREVDMYHRTCYSFGRYLKHNISVNGKCIGKHLVFSDDGALFTIIQNGSLMVTRAEEMVIYRDFCVEETGSSVLAAYVCDEQVFPDPFDVADKVIISSALLTLFVTVLIYAFERNFHTTFGKLIMIHVGFLFVALLLEAALAEFEESIYSTIVFILIEASYVSFVTANLHLMISNQGDYQKLDVRNVAYLAFGCCILWVISALLTLYCNEIIVVLCAVFSSLVFSILVNVFVLRGIVSRRHLLLTSMDSCYEISDSMEFSSYVQYRKEVTILSTIAAILQLLHWIVYAAGRYSLLYGLSWCGLTMFAVFVCFRFRSITVLSGSVRPRSISKELRHRHRQEQQELPQQQQQQQQQFEEVTSNSYQENGYHQMQSNSYSHNHHHQKQQQQNQWGDSNQKHTSLAPVVEEDGPLDAADLGLPYGEGLSGMERRA